VIDRAMGGTTGRSPFVFVINPSSSTTEVADALLARYDTNKDGKLNVASGTAAELRLDAESLARAQDDLFRLKLGLHTNQVENTASVRIKRREIAKIITVMRAREHGIETQGRRVPASAQK
jgi:ribosomal protein L29